MAYITTDEVKRIRNNLKAKFPKFRFGVRHGNHTSISVTIKSGPVEFAPGESHAQINHYYPDNYEHGDLLREIIKVINEKNHNNSRPEIDYFDVGYYVSIHQGSWNKPYVVKENK